MTPYIHRDISWLAFNYRVLQEAKDNSVPLYEKIKFLAIYSSNLDEFFRVRVANHRNIVRAGKKTRKNLDFEPENILTEILKIVNEQQEEFSQIFERKIVTELAKNGMNIKRRKKLSNVQIQFIEEYFNEYMLPFVQPVLLVDKKIRPFLNNASLFLALIMTSTDKAKKDEFYYAIVKVPSDHLPRYLELPTTNESKKDFIILDDIVRHNIRNLFPGYDIQNSHSIKLTRDAELYIDDEYSGDLIEKIKKSLNKRSIGTASRLVYDRNMPDHLLSFLKNVFELDDFDLLPEGRYHNNFDLFKFPWSGEKHLKDKPQPPLKMESIENAESIFDEIKKGDILNHVPYHSYESVIKFFEDAATDPTVTHIKIIQYRVAKISRIMDALILAVKNGKQVSAFVEIKARFDEAANLQWGERLEKAGVAVNYSIPGLKVHSKMTIVRRIEKDKAKIYCYFSTGNFHEDTARLYSDIGVFTADKNLTSEATRVFSYLETKNRPPKPFKYLAVGQFNLKPMLLNLITYETSQAEKGKTAQIILKMNSLQDSEMIAALYKASKKGVEIKLIIRGICSLVPGIAKVSENIEAISIVDRYLEHSRIFYFHHSGDELTYLSSADWMVRNLHHRIETIFPILNQNIKNTIKDLLHIQLNDNVKARIIDVKKNNSYIRDTTDLAIRSQVESYYYFKRKLEEEKAKREKERDLID
jgi:polyphosphate kinase